MEEFLPIEVEFLAAADVLPEKYRDCFLPPLDGGLCIPAVERKVGNMEIQIFRSFIHIKIGNHTELRVSRAEDAVGYIRDVLTDQIVFCFHKEGVEYFRVDEFESLSESDWNYFVWSGPFRYAFMERGE